MPKKFNSKAEEKAYRHARYVANKENILARKRVYNEANKEKIAASRRDYRQANKEKIAACDRGYYVANRERILARRRAYRKGNKEKIAARSRRYWKSYIEGLSDIYLRHDLGIPKELMEVKRLQLQIHRLIKEMK